jgi:hypothetical protein
LDLRVNEPLNEIECPNKNKMLKNDCSGDLIGQPAFQAGDWDVVVPLRHRGGHRHLPAAVLPPGVNVIKLLLFLRQ